MFDFLLRALSHPRDYITIFSKHTLVLTEVIKESENIYSFIFKLEKPIFWKAGQHGVFYFPHTKITGKTWRPFSVASSSEEGVIRIATIIKENPSDFKRNLLLLTPGDTLKMNGPFGEFHTSKKTHRIVGIAGGIGITPFRALIKNLSSQDISNTKLTLIYGSQGSHTFRNEFDALLPHKNIEIIYTTTSEELTRALDAVIAKDKKDARYFISGSPGMIGAIKKSLKEKGINKIVNDPFKGY